MKKTALSICLFAVAALSANPAFAGNDLGERIAKFYERVATDVDTNKPDCEKIGKALMKHLDEDIKLFAEAKQADAGKSAKAKDAESAEMEKKYGARIAAAEKKMKPMQKCASNATVKGYWSKVDPE